MLAPTASGFSVRLALLLSPAFLLLALYPAENLDVVTHTYARVCTALLGLLGEDVLRTGTLIEAVRRPTALEVAPVCTGYFVTWIYASAVLAFPATWIERAKGLVLGVVLVFTINVVRITSLFYVLESFPEHFDEVHLVVWQSVVVLVVALTWYGWAARRAPARPSEA